MHVLDDGLFSIYPEIVDKWKNEVINGEWKVESATLQTMGDSTDHL